MNRSLLPSITLNWNKQNTPVCREFDDIYFSSQNGLAETRYVFLAGNHLPDRFISHPREKFVVAETGFGTGLNFLALWQAFRELSDNIATLPVKQLHFISCEKFPLNLADLAAVHQCWPELAPLAEQLRAQWPVALTGCHRLLFDQQQVIVDLWFGDLNDHLFDWQKNLQQQVDAWFLDGFAPKKNPDLWTTALFETMVSSSQPDCTFATFTAAGFVRRGLQQAGFYVQKKSGFAQKRERLIGKLLTESSSVDKTSPASAPTTEKASTIAIIGGGIASALLADALLRRGAQVKLYCQDSQPATAASGNRQGVLYPLIIPGNNVVSDFFITAFLYARRYYDQLSERGIVFDHDWCGVCQLAFNAQSRRKMLSLCQDGWPSNLLAVVDGSTLSAFCGVSVEYDAIHYPSAGWLSPLQLTQQLIASLNQQGMQSAWQHQLTTLMPYQSGWQLHFKNGQIAHHDTVILANGHHLNTLPQTAHLPLAAIRGQISYAVATNQLKQLHKVLCYDGYLIPANPSDNLLCLGASHNRKRLDSKYCAIEQQQNYQRLSDALPSCLWLTDIDISSQLANCAIRSSVRDHLPMVGGVPDFNTNQAHYQHSLSADAVTASLNYPNLFMLGGLGSRGLCAAPLLAEVLAAQIYHEPLPLSQSILSALAPNRLWKRKLKR